MRRIRLGIAAALVALGVTAAVPAGAATETIRQLDVNTWFGGNEGPGGSVGTVKLVPGPATPPLGLGSAELTVDDTGRASLGTNEFRGVRLDTITLLDFWGYVVNGTTNQLVLGFDVDYDATDTNTAFQGRLVFLPGTPPPANAWRHLDTFTDGTWYSTGAPGDSVCTQASTCTWAQVLTSFPDAAIRNDAIAKGALLLRLGGPIAGGATAYVDALTLTTTSGSTTADFEPGSSITPSVGPMGTNVTIEAYGFKPGSKATVRYYTDTRRKLTLCRTTADANGKALCAATIPTLVKKAGAAGAHRVRIDGRKVTRPSLLQYNMDFILTP